MATDTSIISNYGEEDPSSDNQEGNQNNQGQPSGSEGGTQEGNQGSDSSQEGSGQDQNQGQNQLDYQVAKPENVPDKFWDEQNQQVNQDALIKAYNDLESEYSKVKQSQQPPEEYEVHTPEKFKDQVDLSDDPMIGQAMEKAKELGWTQEQFDQGIEMFMEVMNDQYEADMAREVENLGGEEKVKEMVVPIQRWAKQNLSAEAYQTLLDRTTDAKSLQLFDEIRKVASVQANPPDEGTKKGTEPLTENQLHNLMKKPEYYDPHRRDPEVVKQVEEGFKQLYPDQ
jgi:hypothetical protein